MARPLGPVVVVTSDPFGFLLPLTKGSEVSNVLQFDKVKARTIPKR